MQHAFLKSKILLRYLKKAFSKIYEENFNVLLVWQYVHTLSILSKTPYFKFNSLFRSPQEGGKEGGIRGGG